MPERSAGRRAFPALGLDADDIQPQNVFLDYAVNDSMTDIAPFDAGLVPAG